MGRVEYQGRWIAPEAAAAAVKGEGQKLAALAEYNARRDKLNEQAESVKARVAETEKRVRPAARSAYRARHSVHHDLAIDRLKLALWCEQAGLEAEATVEFTTAIHLDPRIDEAWRHLGYVRHDGRWMPAAQATARGTRPRPRAKPTATGCRSLKKWQAWLGDPKLRLQAEEQLTKVTDPRAVVAVGLVFCERKSIADQAWASASSARSRRRRPPGWWRCWPYTATSTTSGDAARVLASRPPRDYLESLVEMIHTPAQLRDRAGARPGSSGLLVVETPRYHLERSYDAPPPSRSNSSFCGLRWLRRQRLADRHQRATSSVRRTGLQASRRLGSGRSRERSPQRYVMAEAENRTAALIAAANLKAVAAQQWLAADIRDLEPVQCPGCRGQRAGRPGPPGLVRCSRLEGRRGGLAPLVLRPDRL